MGFPSFMGFHRRFSIVIKVNLLLLELKVMFLDGHQNKHQIYWQFPARGREIEDTVNSALTFELDSVYYWQK
jgi:hypothetical protein